MACILSAAAGLVYGGEMLTISIPGRPVPKKNNSIMVKGRNLILPSKAYAEYHKFCIGNKRHPGWLAQWGNIQYTEPVQMTCLYWYADFRWWGDLINLLEATADILQDADILKDDKLVRSVDGSRIMGIDKENPRTEIAISILGDL